MAARLASAARSSSSAPSSARANGAISAASPPPAASRSRAAFGQVQGHAPAPGALRDQETCAPPACACTARACLDTWRARGRCNGLGGLGAQRDPVALLRRLHRVLPSPSRRTPPPATSLRASANRGCNVSSSPACTGSGRWKYAPAARSNPTWPEDASTPSADAICASGNRPGRPAARYRCAARKPAASTRTPRPHSHRRPRPDAAPRPRPRTPAPFRAQTQRDPRAGQLQHPGAGLR